MWLKWFIDVVFASGLFINAMLFIPQAIKIYREKTAAGLSLITFVGFCLTQLAAVFYGYLNHDYILMFGFSLALITCGAVTILIIFFRAQTARQ